MKINKSTVNKIKTIIFNYDLLNVDIQKKINNIFDNQSIKVNDKYIKKFAEYFNPNEIDNIFENLTQTNESNIDSTPIVYFSMEYGISDLLPVYSGGLGILAGDHLKQASESNINLIGVGLFYKYGYFKQKFADFEQKVEYEETKINKINPEPVKKSNGQDLIIKVNTDKFKIYAQVWRITVGKNQLLLLDTDIEQNRKKQVRNITNKLYGGSRTKRFLQEMLLGIGGMRLICKLGIKPLCIHINEGHCAFALMERIRKIMKNGFSFDDAVNINYNSAVFTTHTPVIHGNEEFEPTIVKKYMSQYLKSFDMNVDEFISLNSIENQNILMMTALGLKNAKYKNGVSELHGITARKMWRKLWDDKTPQISHITNGIHINTWLNPLLRQEYYDTSGDTYSEKTHNLPSEKLIELRITMKKRLIDYINHRFSSNINFNNQLILGFARRFAPYKRANLLFNDMHRIKRILKHNNILLFIAGKAHPKDVEGNAIINDIMHKINDYGLEKHIFLLDNYDMELAKQLTSGCDIWLNTPLKPMEASGTSGMKNALNGGINFSIADGWWAEAYDGKNGFLIEEFSSSDEIKYMLENSYLLNVLEYKIIPLFNDYSETNEGLTAMMKHSMSTIHKKFTAKRMLEDYSKYYTAAKENFTLTKSEIED